MNKSLIPIYILLIFIAVLVLDVRFRNDTDITNPLYTRYDRYGKEHVLYHDEAGNAIAIPTREGFTIYISE